MSANLDGPMTCSVHSDTVTVSSCLACPEQGGCKRGGEIKKEFGKRVPKGKPPEFNKVSPPFGGGKAGKPEKACLVPGCKSPVLAKGLCSSHYGWQHSGAGQERLAKLGIKLGAKKLKPKPAPVKPEKPGKFSLGNQPYFFIFLERTEPVKLSRAEDVRAWLQKHPEFKGRIFRGKEVRHSSKVVVTLSVEK